MRKTPTTKFVKLLAEVRREILERIRIHVLRCIQVETVYGQARLLLNNPEHSYGVKLIQFNLDRMNPTMDLIKQDHASIVSSVVAYNNIVLSCNGRHAEMFIMFDESTAEVFSDEKAHLSNEYSGSPSVVRRRKMGYIRNQ